MFRQRFRQWSGFGPILKSGDERWSHCHKENSISNPLHILQEHLLATAVIKFRGPAVGVAGYPLSGFKSAVMLQKIRDAGSSE